MRPFLFAPAVILGLAVACLPVLGQKITVSFPAAQSAKALDGRVLLLLSNDPDPKSEPRMEINDTPRSQMVFGVTVDGLKPGEPVTIGEAADRQRKPCLGMLVKTLRHQLS